MELDQSRGVVGSAQDSVLMFGDGISCVIQQIRPLGKDSTGRNVIGFYLFRNNTFLNYYKIPESTLVFNLVFKKLYEDEIFEMTPYNTKYKIFLFERDFWDKETNTSLRVEHLKVTIRNYAQIIDSLNKENAILQIQLDKKNAKISKLSDSQFEGDREEVKRLIEYVKAQNPQMRDYLGGKREDNDEQ